MLLHLPVRSLDPSLPCAELGMYHRTALALGFWMGPAQLGCSSCCAHFPQMLGSNPKLGISTPAPWGGCTRGSERPTPVSLGNQGLGKIPGPGITHVKIPASNYLERLCDHAVAGLIPSSPILSCCFSDSSLGGEPKVRMGVLHGQGHCTDTALGISHLGAKPLSLYERPLESPSPWMKWPWDSSQDIYRGWLCRSGLQRASQELKKEEEAISGREDRVCSRKG